MSLLKPANILLAFSWLLFLPGVTFAQSTERLSGSAAIGIAISPEYGEYNPISLHLFWLRPTLKEYHVLTAFDFHPDKQFYRFETGINWHLSQANRTRKFQLFPSTSVSYVFHSSETETSQITYDHYEAFISIGINGNLRVHKSFFVTGRAQTGWGQQWESVSEVDDAVSDNTAFNVFYYVGLRYLINDK